MSLLEGFEHQQRLYAVQHERPHASETYDYKRFLTHIIPKFQRIEAISPRISFYYVFVSYDFEDFLDFWGRTPHILSLLDDMVRDQGIPKEDLFNKVHVYSHSRDAHNELIDSLHETHMTNMSGNMEIRNRQLRGDKHKLKLLNTFARPHRLTELQHPRDLAVEAVSALRDPATSARIATMGESNPEASRVIANVARHEAYRNRAKTARSVRANLAKTVRNQSGIPKNMVRNQIYSYLIPDRRRMTPALYQHRMSNASRTANVRPMHLNQLFENNETRQEA
jgi:hypothetical protein